MNIRFNFLAFDSWQLTGERNTVIKVKVLLKLETKLVFIHLWQIYKKKKKQVKASCELALIYIA